MKHYRAGAVAIAVLLTAGLADAKDDPAAGSFRLLGHFESVKTTVVQNGVSISSGISPGIIVIFDGTAEPFRFGVFDSTTVFHSRQEGDKLSLEGHSVRKELDGDEWYSRFERVKGTQERGTQGIGRYELLGGTGKYRGLTGACTYEVSNLSGKRAVSMATCNWQINPSD